MKRIKILFVIENLNAGGAEKVFLNLINNIDKSKFNPKLILFNKGSSTKGSYPLPDHTEVIFLDKSKKTGLFALVSAVKQEEADIVFSNLAPINILCGLTKTIIRNSKTKYIFRETTIRSISIKKTKEKFIERLLYSKLVKYFYKKADKIISLSEGAKLDLVNNFKIKDENIKVIYNPLNINEISNLSYEKVEDIEFDKNVLNLISVGTLTKSKGYSYLIKAVKILKIEKNIKVHLYIIGTGELEESLKLLVKQKKLESEISFLGFKSNPYKYIKKSDIFILPALWEGFGNVIVEAMASGTPVISTNCESGPKEIIESNRNGLIVQMKSSISLVNGVEKLIADNDLYKEIKNKGLKRASEFDIPIILNKYESELENTINY